MKSQPTVKVILDTRYSKLNGEKFPAKLRITFQKKQVYFKSKLDFTEKEWEKIKKNLRADLSEIELKAKKIIEKLPVFSFDQFRKKFLNYTETITIAGPSNNLLLI